MKRVKWFTLTMLAFLLLISSSALAFGDITLQQGKIEIEALQKKGIMNGIDKKNFAPNRSLTYAEAVTLFVKAFNLNIDHLRFIKEPKVSELYKNIKDDAWYAKAYMILFYNGVELPPDIKPQQTIKREEFAFYLHKILSSKFEYAVIQRFNEFNDYKEVNVDYQASIQEILNLGIIKLGKDNKFYPKKEISRADAAIMIFNTLQYIENIDRPIVKPPIKLPPVTEENVDVLVDKINESVNKVTLDWGDKGNSGYSISIDKIEFMDNEATIYYSLNYPDPDGIYLTVITRPKVTTYVDAKYQIKTVQSNRFTLPIEKPKKELKSSQPDSGKK